MEYEILVRWRAFPLHPETPDEGISRDQLFGPRLDIQEIRSRLAKTAGDLGLPFRGSDTLYNSRLAQELGLWSETKNRGDAFHAAVFKAYFVDGRNISNVPILVELASSVGLSAHEAAEVLAARAFKEAVDSDWELSREKSVTAVPTFILNQDRLVGAQPYAAFQELMGKNGAKRRVHTSGIS